MKENNSKTIAFKQREENHISKYKFKANEYGKIDFKVIPYPKYKKVLRNGRKFIKFKNIFIILLIILISYAYFFLTNKRLSHLIDKKRQRPCSHSPLPQKESIRVFIFWCSKIVILQNIFLLLLEWPMLVFNKMHGLA